jgi:hypothetical protein
MTAPVAARSARRRRDPVIRRAQLRSVTRRSPADRECSAQADRVDDLDVQGSTRARAAARRPPAPRARRAPLAPAASLVSYEDSVELAGARSGQQPGSERYPRDLSRAVRHRCWTRLSLRLPVADSRCRPAPYGLSASGLASSMMRRASASDSSAAVVRSAPMFTTPSTNSRLVRVWISAGHVTGRHAGRTS